MWDTILTTCVFFTFIDIVVSDAKGRSADLRLGFLAGALALLNPAVGTGVGACLLWRWSRTSEHRIRSIALTVAMTLAMVAPWIVRNYVVFHKLIFIRGNFGHELYKGSNLAATGENNTGFNPVQSVSEFKRYAAMGEVAYVKADGDAAKSLIRKYPGWFFKLTRRRIDAYWNGPVDVTSMFAFSDEHLALKKFLYRLLSFAGLGGLLLALFRRQTYAYMFAGVVLLYPIIYYITFPNVRYRLPLEPILVMYGLYLASAVIGRSRGKDKTLATSSQEPEESLAAV
jgi:hypothetical protein